MLSVAPLNARPGASFQEGGARRLQWGYPDGVRILGEYWLETDAPRVVAAMEAEEMFPLGR